MKTWLSTHPPLLFSGFLTLHLSSATVTLGFRYTPGVSQLSFLPIQEHSFQSEPSHPPLSFYLVLKGGGGDSEKVSVGPDCVFCFCRRLIIILNTGTGQTNPLFRSPSAFKPDACLPSPVTQQVSGRFSEMIHSLYQVNVLTTGKDRGCILLLIIIIIICNGNF